MQIAVDLLKIALLFWGNAILEFSTSIQLKTTNHPAENSRMSAFLHLYLHR
jgi:hypothetical protein